MRGGGSSRREAENGKWKVSFLPLSKGEDRMLNELVRIDSILGEGSSRRETTKFPPFIGVGLRRGLARKGKHPLLESVIHFVQTASIFPNRGRMFDYISSLYRGRELD